MKAPSAFGIFAKAGEIRRSSGVSTNFLRKEGEAAMSGSGKNDKGKKEQKKKPEHNLKEKRKLKNEKKQKGKFVPG